MYSADELYDDETTSGLAYERTGSDPDGLHGPKPCASSGHVDGCSGKAGGEHELRPGWIEYEDADGFLIEMEVSGAR